MYSLFISREPLIFCKVYVIFIFMLSSPATVAPQSSVRALAFVISQFRDTISQFLTPRFLIFFFHPAFLFLFFLFLFFSPSFLVFHLFFSHFSHRESILSIFTPGETLLANCTSYISSNLRSHRIIQ